MKKFLALLLAMALSLGIPAAAADTRPIVKGDIVVLYTNDVHCKLESDAEKGGLGYAEVAGYRNEMKALTDHVALVDVGDAVQGTAVGTLSKGAYPVEIMNQVGYHIAVPGNHEFDYGMQNFLDLAKRAKSNYYCCNLIDLKTNKPLFEPYKMMRFGDKRVAFVGIDTPEALTRANPKHFQDEKGNYLYGFCQGNNGKDLYTAVQNAINAAIRGGADYVIAVGHCGTDDQSSPWTSREIIANTTGLSAFLDGHSHSTIPAENVKDVDGDVVILSSTGTKLAALGKLVIKMDGTINAELVTECKTKDDTVDTFVKGVLAKNEALLKKTAATSAAALVRTDEQGKQLVRMQETNLGDLVADAYRELAGADIALVNGGSICADLPAGEITYGQMMDVQPAGNTLCVVEATGQEILDALEMSARSVPEENSGFLQVSALSYSINTAIPSTVKVDENGAFVRVEGERRVSDVLVMGKPTLVNGIPIANAQPIDPKKTYSVASQDALLKKGADGLNMFQDNKLLQDSVLLDNQLLISYITEKLGGVVPAQYAKAQGRIAMDYKLPFTDVPKGIWFYDGVKYAYQNKLFSGTTATTFGPNRDMTRGMLVTVLWRMAGEPIAQKPSGFQDVANNSYCAMAVAWASSNGIVSGFDANRFAPDQKISREQLCAILMNYAKLQKYDTTAGGMAIKEFSDYGKIAGYAVPGMAWANAAGLVQGYPKTNTIDPKGSAARGQVAVILQRFSERVAVKPAA